MLDESMGGLRAAFSVLVLPRYVQMLCSAMTRRFNEASLPTITSYMMYHQYQGITSLR